MNWEPTMPVVINEFEAVAEAPRNRTGEDESGAKQPSEHEELEPKDVTPVLRALEIRALRAWAH